MRQVQLIMACEGPLALNNQVFELCRDFLKPQGDRFFQQVSRYLDCLAKMAPKTGSQSGHPLKLILPFLKAKGLTNAQLAEYSRKKLALMPGAEGAYRFLRSRNLPIFAISTGYRQFAEAVGQKLGLDSEHIFGAELDLDRLELSGAEAQELAGFLQEITQAPEIELPPAVASIADLPEPAQQAVAVLDRIFGEQLPAMPIGAVLEEVKLMGGPEKAEPVAASLAKTGLSLKDTIYVGGSLADVQAFEAVRAGGGLGLSFNGDPSAVAAAEVVVVSDSAWSMALLTAIFQLWGREGVLEVAAPETRDKSRSLVLPEEVIEPIMMGLDGCMINLYLSKSADRDQIVQESRAMQAQLRGEAVAALG